MTVIKDIEKKIKKLEKKIKKIQKECSHPESCRESKYIEVTDEVGIDVISKGYTHYCKLCNRRWEEDIPIKERL